MKPPRVLLPDCLVEWLMLESLDSEVFVFVDFRLKAEFFFFFRQERTFVNNFQLYCKVHSLKPSYSESPLYCLPKHKAKDQELQVKTNPESLDLNSLNTYSQF